MVGLMFFVAMFCFGIYSGQIHLAILLAGILCLAVWLKHKITGVCPNCESWMLQFKYKKDRLEEWSCTECLKHGVVKDGKYT